MKIAILYICTGKYEIFWKDFYLSCEKNFIPGAEKEYFVFTDAETLDFENKNKNIHKIFQTNLGWPNNTLMRFDMFKKIKKDLMTRDYMFFFNSNLIFQEEITSTEFLPQDGENLVACIHPGFFDKKRKKFTYEKNPLSKAYIPEDKGRFYFAGGINGGRTTAFLEAMDVMDANIKEDTKNNVIAVWHDESHWNRYLLDRQDVKMLHPGYLYPDGMKLPFAKKISIRDKNKYGGHDTMRGTKSGLLKKIKAKVGKLIKRT